MTDAKKPGSPKQIVDVSHPGKSAPSDTSKPVIVTNRPMLKDPMMVDEDSSPTSGMPEKEAASLTKQTAKPELQPTAAADDKATADKPEPEAPAAKQPEPDSPKPAESKKEKTPEPTSDEDDKDEASPAAQTAEQQDAEAEKKAKHEAEVQKLADSKKYFLPINAVEKRRTKRIIALGVVFSIVLALAWVDIALDAGLIQVSSVKPVTHFFSN